MLRFAVFALVAASPLCLGVSCTIVPPDGTVSGGTPLRNVIAEILITQATDDATATVAMSLSDANGRGVELEEDQRIEINDRALNGLQMLGQYLREIPAADSYVLTVFDPSRGEETTSLAAPADFSITSPAPDGDASLSGFTLSWSNADPQYDVVIELRQTFAGQTEIQTLSLQPDTGARDISADELRDFVQGEELTVIVTKSITRTDPNGFASGDWTISVVAEQDVTPRP